MATFNDLQEFAEKKGYEMELSVEDDGYYFFNKEKASFISGECLFLIDKKQIENALIWTTNLRKNMVSWLWWKNKKGYRMNNKKRDDKNG